jgi:hypothetical protein
MLSKESMDYFKRRKSALALSVFVFFLMLSGLAKSKESTWKSFSNRAGWTINYPANWTVSSCKSCSDPSAPDVYVNFSHPKDGTFGEVEVEPLTSKPAEVSVDAWLSKVKQSANQNPRLNEQTFTLDGLPALRVRYRNPFQKGYESESVYVVSPSRTFAIEFGGVEMGRSAETSMNYSTYLEMVKSFRVKR